VDPWISAYADATTPNPCFNCNRSIRFGFLLQRALALGADYLATGHYARVSSCQLPAASYQLLKGLDAKKDQSYVLHVLGQSDLRHAMFPCGGYVKSEVRELARKFGLPTAERAESQDLCFLTQGDYRGFLTRQAPDVARAGAILNTRGEHIGTHDGLPFYTVGQRKGLNIAAKSADTEPLYVLRLDATRNALIVGAAHELGARSVSVRSMHYCSDVPLSEPLRCTAKVRYKAKEASGVLIPLADGGARFEFDEPQRDATPGQGLVAYDGDAVIGGGVVAKN
jgi:tRNA-specific 2-thiouridylase